MKLQQMLSRVQYALGRFFYGRNGTDPLNLALLGLCLFIALLAQLTHLTILFPLYYLLMGGVLFRMLSKNLYRRQRENAWFLGRVGFVKTRLRLHRKVFQERKTHRYFRCRTCRQFLRVPRGRGKIDISCSRCGCHMIRKS